MAINVYTPRCHLLCHDDVIGSRRVSYILYLTDPNRPWRADGGGALRLYPTRTFIGDDGEETKVPSPDFSVSIPPAFNQLTFFAVQPGESFHDVEEVYAQKESEKEEYDGGRVRIAISGDKYELPQAQIRIYDQENGDTTVDGNGKQPVKASDEDNDSTLTVADLDFLLEFLAPTYPTPDTLSSLSSIFADESSLRLSDVLSAKFSSLRSYITSQEQEHPLDNLSSAEIEASTDWKVARPPHKHRFLFQQPSLSTQDSSAESTPLHSLLNTLLPSCPFRKWLALATGLTLTSHEILARRFRRGMDYTLATGYNEDSSRLEVTLGITPTKGWGDDEDEDADKEGKAEDDSPTVANESKEPEEDEHDPCAAAREKNDRETTPQSPLHPSNPQTTSPPAPPRRKKENRTTPALQPLPCPRNPYPPPQTPRPPPPPATPSPPPTSAATKSTWPVTTTSTPAATPASPSPLLRLRTLTPRPPPPSPPFFFLFLTPQSKSNPDPKSNPNPNPNPTTTKSSDPAVYHSATAGEDDGVLFFMAAGWN
ncbi:MAG: pkhd-type hydroxylase tpa1 [Lasallia pustulata]|uniref:Pkhd-type hydroxylase tpa1 n=1 Tax=Lasallia pustulata TaxID=136370 RepID=A0A5M8PFI1_9LECA|nr:MAG: pkhd-type hydroxylase tpa1 [Lasallia pustulata]